MEDRKVAILVVDDEKDIRDSILNMLRRRGFDADAVSSAEEAIVQIKAKRYELVLMDIVLPELSGIQALEQVKKISPETEVIMITGHASIGTAIESMRNGAFDYLEKPLSPERLIGIIYKALDRHLLAEQVALYEISKAVFSTINLDELLNIIVELTMRVLRADDTSVMLFDDKGQLYIAVSNGLSEQVRKDTRLKVGERIAGWVAESRQPLILINGLKGDMRFEGVRDNISSSIIIPLISGSSVLGILTANRTVNKENFNKGDLYKANIFASLVSLALNNAQLYRRLLKVNEDLNASQKQLIQSMKLAALGQLVSEMAHEVNNPLMVISGIAQLLLCDEQNGKLQNDLQTIVDECQRAKSIMQRLLKFSRPGSGEFRTVDVNASIEYLLSIVRHQFETTGIRIETRFESERFVVLGDEQQIQEVLLNLLNNARDAIKGAGRVEIATHNYDHTVSIEVADSGQGISPEVMERLFSPYFTTKSNGNGLGLSICRTIMRNHKGDLVLRSMPGKGTTAVMTLPLLSEAQTAPADNGR